MRKRLYIETSSLEMVSYSMDIIIVIHKLMFALFFNFMQFG